MYFKNQDYFKDQEKIKMLKVAFICDDLMVGGWTSITDMILNFRKIGVEPFVVCLFGKGHYAEILEKANIKVHLLDLKKSNAPLKFLELVSIFKKEKPDIVHTNLHYSDFFGGAAAIAAGVKHRVIQIHSIKEKYKHPMTWLKRRIISSASVVAAVSDATGEAFKNEYPGLSVKVTTIPNGIDIREFRRRLDNASLSRRDRCSRRFAYDTDCRQLQVAERLRISCRGSGNAR